MTDSFNYDVFISHSSRDKSIVRELARRLNDDGLRVWFDEWEILPGDMISLKIEQGLEQSRTLLLAMSGNSFASEWVTLERHTALFRDPTNTLRRFIPLRLDDAEIKDTLKQFAYIDWRNPDEVQYAKLLAACTPYNSAIRDNASRQDDSLSDSQLSITHFQEGLLQPPSDISDFYGRTRDIKLLSVALRDERRSAHIAIISGMAGVGKTVLAVHVAQSMKESYPDGHLFLELQVGEQTLSPIEVMRKIIQGLNPKVQVPNDPDEIETLYRSALYKKRVLIICDNAQNSDQLRSILPPSSCGLIITSQKGIKITNAYIHHLDIMPQREATRLVRLVAGNDRITESEGAELARLGGGLPLALRIIGSFLKANRNWSVPKYIEVITDEHERLKRLNHDDLSVEAVLASIAKQLINDNLDLATRWQVLSVFPANFDHLAAADVWEITEKDALDNLTFLVQQSLLIYDDKNVRYFLHPLIRPVARAMFRYVSGIQDTNAELYRIQKAQVRHATYYRAILASANMLFLEGGAKARQGLDLFDNEWENIRAGQRWTAEQTTLNEVAARLCSIYPDAGWHCLRLRQTPNELIFWLDTAILAARQLREHARIAAHLAKRGSVERDVGNLQDAIAYYNEALDILARYSIPDRLGKGRILGNLGNAYLDMKQTDRAIEFFKEAILIAQEIIASPQNPTEHKNALRSEMVALLGIGSAEAAQSRFQDALRFYYQSQTIAESIYDLHGQQTILIGISEALMKLERFSEAIHSFQKAETIANSLSDDKAQKFLASRLTIIDTLNTQLSGKVYKT